MKTIKFYLHLLGKKLVMAFEGLRLKAYLCAAGRWTIGYGNTFYEEDTVGVAQCGNCGELMPVVIT